jgi:hypothetical protein
MTILTVKELIEKLSKFPQDMVIIVLVGNLWGDLTMTEKMGDTVVLSADKANTIGDKNA